ncbi:MAG: hypothetical protein WAU86_09200 [Oricola sp.]
MPSETTAPTRAHRLKRLFSAPLIAVLWAIAPAAPASAAITSMTVASGTYGGLPVRSAPAELALQVEVASPSLAVRVDGAYADDDGTGNISTGDAVTYVIEVRNAGDVGLAGVAVSLELRQGPEGFASAGPPRLTGGDDGNPGILDRGETWRFEARYRLAIGNLEQRAPLIATVAASGEATGKPVADRSQARVALPPLQGIEPRLLSLSHEASKAEAAVGDAVGYTMTIYNRSGRDLSARLTAALADGTSLAAGSAAVNGVPIQPASAGNRLDFGVLSVPLTARLTVTYSGLVTGTAPGFGVNAATLTDPATGIALLPPSVATVRIGPASRDGCTPLSIHVFDDGNRDSAANEGEAGIAGVRVSAGGDNPFTTGPDGWFRSPCANVSRLAGIDLRLTLDEGTLPDGYFVTTRNPLGIRVQPGQTGEVAFGVAAARVVRIDLNEAAFTRNTTTLDEEMTAGITRLISVLGIEPSILRLTYYAHPGETELAEQRLEAVREMVLDRWTTSGGAYDLHVEARVVQSGG